MGDVVKFPTKDDYDIDKLPLEEADIISICPMDEELVPLYENEAFDVCWYGVVGFWHMGADLCIRLCAVFKDKKHAVTFSLSKNENVESDMPADTLSELRAQIIGSMAEPDDETRH